MTQASNRKRNLQTFISEEQNPPKSDLKKIKLTHNTQKKDPYPNFILERLGWLQMAIAFIEGLYTG